MRILGIDLGSASVKAVELESGFGRFEIQEYHERKVEAEATPMEAASALISSLARPPDRIVVALRTARTTFRNLSLPTRDRRAIQSSVGFELDDELPFPVEQAVHHYAILSHAGSTSKVHVVATLRRHVEALLTDFGNLGVDPDLVTSESWAFRALMNRVLPPEEREYPVLLLQLGHEHTTIYLHHEGAPVLAREVAVGGKDLTMAVAQAYGIPYAQAEEAKHSNGFVLPNSQRENHTPDQVRFSDTLLAPLVDLLREIRQAVLTAKNLTHKNVGMVYLSGGTSQLPGLDRLIEEEMVLPVKHLAALSTLTSSSVTYSEQADKNLALAAALALCQVGPEKNIAINLRQGELAKKGRSREVNLAAFKRPALALGAILACAVASLVAQRIVYSDRIDKLDKSLDRVVGSFLGKEPRAVKALLKDPKRLKKEVDTRINRQKELARLMAPNPSSPLNFLRDLSGQIPRNLTVDLIRFEVGAAPSAAAKPFDPSLEQAASLTFVVPDQKTLDQLKPLLAQRLKGMSEGSPEPVTGEGAKGIRVTFAGKPSEGSNGH